MGDAEDYPDLGRDPMIAGLEARKAQAIQGFRELNRGAHEGDPGYGPPPAVDLHAQMSAVVALLLSADVIDFREFVMETMVREAEMLEQSLAGAAEHKRQQTGIIVPSGVRNGHAGS